MRYLIILITCILLYGCADYTIEEYPPEWVVASQYLPREKLKGLVHAGFFTMNDSIYSHHCDLAGNMIRLKYNRENHSWKQIKYETHGCISTDS